MFGNLVVPLGRNAALGTMSVETEKFSETVQRHVYEYGLRQILNDAMADKTDDDGNRLADDVIRAKAEKRLAALYAGELRIRNAAEPVDPIEAEAHRIAWAKIVDFIKTTDEYKSAKGAKDRVLVAAQTRANAKGEPEPSRGDLIQRVLDNDPKIMAAAKRIVRERENVAELGVAI